MIILTALEIVLGVILVWILLTQIILPPLFGVPLFPMVRRRWRRVQDELKDAEERVEFNKWRDAVERTRKESKHESNEHDLSGT